jgi:Uri superfamily endonuclease
VLMPTQARINTYPAGDTGTGRGSYVLLTHLPEEQTIAVGSLSPFRFLRGYYAYVGSALGGFRSRLDRHLRTEKKLHWHIDYLLRYASLDAIITCETEEMTECAIARALAQQFESVPRFGASDCRCRSHLFFSTNDMTPSVISALEATGLEPRLKYTRGRP